MTRYEALTHPEHGRRVFDHVEQRWLDATRCAALLNQLTPKPAACAHCVPRDQDRK